jgi:hypothetical protein
MNKWQQKRMLLVLILIGLLAACTAATTSEPPAEVEPVYQTAVPTNTAAQKNAENITATIPAIESKPEVNLDDAVMIYERAGGLKGFGPASHSWTFYADGRIVGSDGREWLVPPEEVARLVDEVLALGFTEFEASYLPEDTCCDRVTHTLIIKDDDEQVYTVSVLDGADAPPELFTAVEMVNSYLMALSTE